MYLIATIKKISLKLNLNSSGREGVHNAYLGVGPESNKEDDIIKHTYYQWVCFVLLGQSVLFYTPRYLWKIWEGGRLKTLASDLSKCFRVLVRDGAVNHLLKHQHSIVFL